jgi:hypothetical protein
MHGNLRSCATPYYDIAARPGNPATSKDCFDSESENCAVLELRTVDIRAPLNVRHNALPQWIAGDNPISLAPILAKSRRARSLDRRARVLAVFQQAGGKR